ncbi:MULTISPECIES: type II toxin-antitoxin system VapB family antitoxin [Roseobacteraceae]|uniref:type II toxin-antitoxin system VapB family antitoxin n=1 Tax=Roseobacteraceae TaxID=2854170 RepID=UPI00261ED74F|nr:MULTISPECIES: type II toxin-antitoxin system VapB family antitoxin [Roseobacteraceae]
MPLYIRDDKVDELAEQVMQATGAKTKTDAVRQALQAALAAKLDKIPLADRIAPIQARLAALGPVDPDFDMKSFTDEMWEGD